MTLRSFSVLAGTTAFAVVLAIATSLSFNSDSAVGERGNSFLPGLAQKATKISTIKVTDGNSIVTLKREGDRFIDASGFPAKMKPVRDLVTSLSTLKIEETKTADKTRHGDLKLDVPTAKEGAGKLVSLLDEDDDVIERVVVGKSDYTVGGGGGGQYVRMADTDQTYLVRGSVKLPYGRSGWFDTKLYKADEKTITKITLSNSDADPVVLTKSNNKLTVKNLAQDKSADDAKISRVSGLIGSLDFDDVRAVKKDSKAIGPTIVAETEAGLRLTIASVDNPKSGARWVRISATTLKDDAKKAADELNARTDGFEFQLSSYQSDIFGWKLKDFEKKADS